jgi:hypothetical protein
MRAKIDGSAEASGDASGEQQDHGREVEQGDLRSPKIATPRSALG